MDGGLDDDWEDASFLDAVLRATDEAEASRNPNPTPTPAPAPIPTSDPFAATPVSYLPAASHPSPALRFSPPRELTQRPPLPPPTAAASARDALATPADAGRGFSPPRELSQRPAPEESSLAIVAASGSAGDHHRFVSMGGGGGVGAKRDREARELERLKVIPFSVFGVWCLVRSGSLGFRCICVSFLMLLILTTAEGAEPRLQANE